MVNVPCPNGTCTLGCNSGVPAFVNLEVSANGAVVTSTEAPNTANGWSGDTSGFDSVTATLFCAQ
jgi:hypothetical protein